MNVIDIDAAKRDVAEAKKLLKSAEARIARLESKENEALLARAETETRDSVIWETACRIKAMTPDLTMKACVEEAMQGALALMKAPHNSERGKEG